MRLSKDTEWEVANSFFTTHDPCRLSEDTTINETLSSEPATKKTETTRKQHKLKRKLDFEAKRRCKTPDGRSNSSKLESELSWKSLDYANCFKNESSNLSEVPITLNDGNLHKLENCFGNEMEQQRHMLDSIQSENQNRVDSKQSQREKQNDHFLDKKTQHQNPQIHVSDTSENFLDKPVTEPISLSPQHTNLDSFRRRKRRKIKAAQSRCHSALAEFDSKLVGENNSEKEIRGIDQTDGRIKKYSVSQLRNLLGLPQKANEQVEAKLVSKCEQQNEHAFNAWSSRGYQKSLLTNMTNKQLVVEDHTYENIGPNLYENLPSNALHYSSDVSRNPVDDPGSKMHNPAEMLQNTVELLYNPESILENMGEVLHNPRSTSRHRSRSRLGENRRRLSDYATSQDSGISLENSNPLRSQPVMFDSSPPDIVPSGTRNARASQVPAAVYINRGPSIHQEQLDVIFLPNANDVKLQNQSEKNKWQSHSEFRYKTYSPNEPNERAQSNQQEMNICQADLRTRKLSEPKNFGDVDDNSDTSRSEGPFRTNVLTEAAIAREKFFGTRANKQNEQIPNHKFNEEFSSPSNSRSEELKTTSQHRREVSNEFQRFENTSAYRRTPDFIQTMLEIDNPLQASTPMVSPHVTKMVNELFESESEEEIHPNRSFGEVQSPNSARQSKANAMFRKEHYVEDFARKPNSAKFVPEKNSEGFNQRRSSYILASAQKTQKTSASYNGHKKDLVKDNNVKEVSKTKADSIETDTLSSDEIHFRPFSDEADNAKLSSDDKNIGKFWQNGYDHSPSSDVSSLTPEKKVKLRSATPRRHASEKHKSEGSFSPASAEDRHLLIATNEQRLENEDGLIVQKNDTVSTSLSNINGDAIGSDGGIRRTGIAEDNSFGFRRSSLNSQGKVGEWMERNQKLGKVLVDQRNRDRNSSSSHEIGHLPEGKSASKNSKNNSKEGFATQFEMIEHDGINDENRLSQDLLNTPISFPKEASSKLDETPGANKSEGAKSGTTDLLMSQSSPRTENTKLKMRQLIEELDSQRVKSTKANDRMQKADQTASDNQPDIVSPLKTNDRIQKVNGNLEENESFDGGKGESFSKMETTISYPAINIHIDTIRVEMGQNGAQIVELKMKEKTDENSQQNNESQSSLKDIKTAEELIGLIGEDKFQQIVENVKLQVTEEIKNESKLSEFTDTKTPEKRLEVLRELSWDETPVLGSTPRTSNDRIEQISPIKSSPIEERINSTFAVSSSVEVPMAHLDSTFLKASAVFERNSANFTRNEIQLNHGDHERKPKSQTKKMYMKTEMGGLSEANANLVFMSSLRNSPRVVQTKTEKPKTSNQIKKNTPSESKPIKSVEGFNAAVADMTFTKSLRSSGLQTKTKIEPRSKTLQPVKSTEAPQPAKTRAKTPDFIKKNIKSITETDQANRSSKMTLNSRSLHCSRESLSIRNKSKSMENLLEEKGEPKNKNEAFYQKGQRVCNSVENFSQSTAELVESNVFDSIDATSEQDRKSSNKAENLIQKENLSETCENSNQNNDTVIHVLEPKMNKDSNNDKNIKIAPLSHPISVRSVKRKSRLEKLIRETADQNKSMTSSRIPLPARGLSSRSPSVENLANAPVSGERKSRNRSLTPKPRKDPRSNRSKSRIAVPKL